MKNLLKKIVTHFQTDRKYQFELGDINTVLYLVAIGLTIANTGIFSTIVFIVAIVISLIDAVVNVRRFNLVALNLGMLAMNIFYLMR